MRSTSAFASISLLVALVSAHSDHVIRDAANRRHVTLAQRQAPAPTVVPLSLISSGMPAEPTPTLFTTFAPGATPPVKGAPPLPSYVPGSIQLPVEDEIPPTTGSELSEWMAKLKTANIPNIPLTKAGDDPCAANPSAVTNGTSAGTCWWTCGGCVRDTDFSTCPDKNTWGVSYDDGPSTYTPKLLQYLYTQKIKSTFFVVGSRVKDNPVTLQTEYMLGHQISVHTWSHPSLTQLTNEQIVAELGWTMIAIKAVLGVTPNTMRPPYGDIDDRVRAICKMMGLTPIIWTGSGENEFDTEDWFIPGGRANGVQSYAAFQKILGLAGQLSTGFIVLEHDLYQQEVDMGMGYFLPLAQQKQFTLESINDCQKITLENSYIETSNGKSSSGNSSSSSSGSLSGSSSGSASASSGVSQSGSLPTGTSTRPAYSATGFEQAGQVTPTSSPSTGAGSLRLDASLMSSSVGLAALFATAGVLIGALVAV